LKILFRLFLLGLLLCAVAGGWVWFQLNRPYKGFGDSVFVDIPIKTRTEEIGAMLAQAGVVEKPWLFTAARVVSPGSVLQAGEYKFDQPASPFQVFAKIARGETFYQVLVVPEGFNMFDIATQLKPLALITPETFLHAARDPSLIADLDPQAPSLEGYLFPDSYRLDKHSTAEGLVKTMTNRFRARWKELGDGGDIHNVVTLASLVEREARLPAERPVIAGVFTNRLRLGMKLGCDPTTVYAALLEHRYRGTIYKSDLESTNPYNTYQNAGLPPGPIANPGLSSLRAALSPAHTNYLYFVAKVDGSGGHTFSDNLASHLAAANVFHAAEARTK
jgi:UPF0755 protein